LATRYNTTVNELTLLNNIDNPDKIEAGTCLLLADTATAVALPNPTDTPVAQAPEELLDVETRAVVDDIIADLEMTEALVDDIIEEVVEEVVVPEAMSLEEVVELAEDIEGQVEVEVGQINDAVHQEVEAEFAEADVPDDVDVDVVQDEISVLVEEEINERIKAALEAELTAALEEQHEIDQALAYIDAINVPDPGPVTMDQAWEWYRNGGGPVMEITDVARLLRWAGFCTHGVEELVLATATVGGESGFKPYVLGDVNVQYEGDESVGFGQIYWSPGNGFTSNNRRPELNINPRDNVQTMYGMYSWRMDRFGWENRFDDWYGHGPGVARHGNAARQAVADIGGCG
jgi:hypothetical protein